MSNKFESLAKEYYEQKLNATETSNVQYSENYRESSYTDKIYYDKGGYSETVTVEEVSGDW